MRYAISTLLVLTGLLLTDSGQAATVTTTNDDGPGSLRDAIANAAAGETINFSTSGTITLTSGELSINKDLIISGPGADNLLIERSTDSGTPNFRIFDVLSGSVTISGLTVSNGRDDVGGGIYSQSDLTLNDCVVAGNSATESGGGIFNTSTMVASNCVVRGNSASGESWDGFGGGMYNSGTLTVINGTIRSNSITSGAAGGYGGGICNDGTLDLVHSVVKDNSATGWQDGGGGFSGGIYNGFGTAYMFESTVSGNIARGGGTGLGEGGGVGNYIGTTELNRCTVSGNSAVGGAGEGGGIANDYGTVYAASSTVSGNISSSVGGGAFNDSGTIDLSYSTVTANVVPGGLADDGAGIFNLWGSVEFKSSIIAANIGTIDFYTGEFGFIVNHGFNLFGSTSGYFVPEPSDQFVSAEALKLGPLQDNGGPTFTHALLCGSPAIDAGNNTGAPDTDQRGFPRIVHDLIDIGAYETGNNVPTINCPNPITLSCSPPEGMVATVSVNVADADGDPLVVVWTVDGTDSQTNLVAAGGPPTDTAVGFTNLFGIGSHELTVSVSDSSGCLATCSTTVEVEAIVPPTVASCPADATIECPATPEFGTPEFSDVCDTNLTVTFADEALAVTGNEVSKTKRTWTATDAHNNSTTCSQTITVLDTAAPTVANCPANATIECPATPVFGTPAFSDACDSNLTITFADETLAVSGKEISKTKRTWTATDAHNNSVTCSQTITVLDTAAPTVANCPANATIECPATPVFATPQFSDACDANLTITFADEALGISGNQVSRIKRTWTATDAHNNSTTCSQTITVIDSAAPTVSCPAPTSASADGNCQATVPNVLSGVTVSDLCSSAGTITLSQSPAAGTLVGLGAHSITVTATDAAGNSASCTTSFTVTDTTAPTVTCPADSNATADANCQATVPNVLGGVMASDNCTASEAITLTQSPLAGALVGLGTNTITVTATDAAGNSATCTTTFTVTGNATLTVACPAATSASADANCQAAVPNVLNGVTMSGGCNGTNGVTMSQSPTAGTLVGLGPQTITVTATDATGNTATCTTTFTVTDDTAPSVICPTLPSASANANCQAPVPTVAATVSDNCTAANAITLTQSPTAGTLVGLGVHTITVTATDAAGNSASCTTTFTVTDNTPPTVSCPAATSASAAANCQAPVPNVLSGVTASDNCSAVTLTQTPTAGTLVGLGAHTITVTATDAAGNSASCTTSFTVTDNTPPTVSCPAATSASAGTNCQAAVPNVLSGVTVSDNCSAVGSITLSQSPAAGTLVGLGTNTITVTATDAAGNSTSCTTLFTVTGNASLTVTCPAVPGANTDANCQAAVPNILSGVTVSSGCGTPGSVSLSQSPVPGTLVGVGTHTITVTATNAAGSSATCTTTFTVTGQAAAIQIVLTTPAYPFASANPLTSIAFNESEVLRSSVVYTTPDTTNCGAGQIGMFYNDEHAMALGVRRVVVKTATGTTTNDYPISPLPTVPASVTSPLVGSTIATGDQAGVDVSGRPLYPALFITDITTDPNSLSGDWQYGGTAFPPTAIFGTWKGFVKTVNKTTSPATVTLTSDADPAENNWVLGPGSDPVPAGLDNEGYGTEVRWDVSQLGLVTGHRYRFYFIVHDGDQNKAGGDTGQACATMAVPDVATKLAIQAQPSPSATAGVPFAQQPVIRIEDAYGNLRYSDNSTVVTVTRSAGSGTLQGTLTATAVNGVVTFANLSHNLASTISLSFTASGLTGATSDNIVVNPGAANKLTIQTQPSATATPGVAFAAQPVIRIEDSYGNLRSSDNSTVVTVARSAGSGTLLGTLTATAVNGVVTFANLSHNVANTITLSFTATGVTSATSSNVVVNPAAFAKLQLLVPGETAAPGTASGKTGTPTSSTAGTAFSITVNAVDNFWNVINTAADMVDISSTDSNATLPADTALVSGTRTLSVTFKSVGSQTLTATDATDGSKTANTSPSMTVNAGAFVKLLLLAPGETAAPFTATGKTGTPTAQSAGTAFNVTVNAVDANWNLVTSANGAAYTIGITSSDANATLPSNANLSSGTRTFSVTLKTAGSATITASDVDDATKTANTSPSITVNAGAFTKMQILVPGETVAPGSSTGKTGTPTAQTAGTSCNVTVNAVDANWNPITTVTDTVGLTSSDPNAVLPANAALVAGTQSFSVTLKTAGSRALTASDISDGTKTANTSASVTVNAGPFVKLQVLVPGETAAPGTASGKTGVPSTQTAGTDFNVTIRSVDALWNVASSTDTVGITSTDSNAALPANVALSAGTKTVKVTLKTVGSYTVTGTDITDGTKPANTSPAITVNVGAADRLVVQTQPSPTATAGISFVQQPVVRIEDACGNLRSSDNTVITVARGAGSGTLQGTLTATAVNGVATFANLSHNVANTITLSFTATGLTSATSDNIVVSPVAFAKLLLLVPGETAAPGSASGKTGTPTARTAGTAFNVTINAVDAFWNLVNTVTDTVGIASSDANADLPASAALVSGTQTFSVTFKTAGSQTLTASDLTNGSKTPSTSPAMTVNAGAFVRLQLLAPGETAAPGTATGKTGTPTAQSAGTAISVTVNAVDANWNLVTSANGLAYTIGITSSDANATLPANADLSSGTRTFSVTLKTAGSATVTASDLDDATKTAATSPIIVNLGAFTKLQILLPGETAAPGSTTGKTGTPTAQTAGTPFNVTVNAVDANWNFVNSVTDTVGITSSDANAVLQANAALVAGTQTFSVTLKTAGSRTLTASDISDGTKTANTSSSVTVNAGAFVKLQVLVPGETAAPGTASGKTGTPSAATAGTAFNVTVNAVDAQWNLVSSTHTVGITSSDTNAVLSANGALSAGTRTVSATLKTAGSHTVTATDITDGTKTANTSPAITVNVGAASKLTVQTQPSTATAGAAFSQQPVIRVEDAYGNLRSSDNSTVVTVARSAGSGTLQGTLTATAVNGVVTFANLSHNVANTITLSFTASGLTSATSDNIVVSPAAFAKLQLLVPGETAAPGSASGKTGSPTSTTAGTAFNITVNAVDALWNVVNTVTDVVDVASSDTNATLPADTALVSGTRTLSVTLKTAGSQTLTATDVTDGSKSANTSPSITVNVGAFVKLQLLVPGETAAPGSATGKSGTPTAQVASTAFTATVNAVDANWNLVTSANGTNYTIGITSSDANATLPANADLSSGTRIFNVTLKTAGTPTVTASDLDDATKTAATTAVPVNPGAFAKLQLLVPGEIASPGSSTGKTGTPSAQTAGTPFNATVNAVDANWNTVTTVTDTAGITSSDANAFLPANVALVAGTQSFSVNLKTVGSRTLTASDLSDGTKTANTSPSITVNVGAFAKLQVLVPGETAAPGTASGKTGTPSAATAGTAFNVTINAVDANWNLVSSTHTVGTTSSDSNAVLPANGALAAGTRTVSVTLKTTGSQTVTATDITDGTKTANTSTAITVNAGAASKLTIQTQPSATATAGLAFGTQPVIRVEDAYGNLRSSDNSTVVTVARSAGSGTLQGTLTATAVNGVATFANLSHNLANTISLSFTASGLTSATSGNVVVSTAAFAKLQLLVPGETAAPGSASGKTGTPTSTTGGTAFNVTVNAVDNFWNVVNTVTDMVDISSSDANATLPADAALVSGTKTLSVTFKTAGSQTLTATDVTNGSKSANTSPSITVNAGAFVKLQLLVPGETAAPGTATGKTGAPTAQSAGTAISVTVNAVDANWNLVTSANGPSYTIRITSSDANAALPSNADLSSGTRTFNVTLKTAGTPTVTASDLDDGTKTAATTTVTVNPAAFAKLQILLPGETASPGSSTGKTGTPSAQTAATPFNVTVNAVDANWNTVNTVTDSVGITSSDANAVLPANAALVAGTKSFSVTLKTSGNSTLTASDVADGTKTANTSPSVTVNAGAFVKLQLLVPGETAAPGTATGKTGAPSSLAAGTAYNMTIRSVDANWNLVSSTHTVGVTSSDSSATLPANGALSAGTRTVSVTLATLGSKTVTATDITDGTKTANTSPAINVIIGTATKLTIQTQPSSSATAGVGFAQQPVIRVEDASGNVVTSDNGRVITVARSAGTGTLQGTLTASTVNGIATFANLSHNVAGTITLSFTASGLTSATSGNIVVSPGTATQLLITTQPSGTRTGSPLVTQPVVKAQDAYGNTSSAGLPASLNVSLALTGGSGSLLGTTSLDIGSAAGNGTATFTTVECSDAGTSKQITASAAGFADAISSLFDLDGVERATGGTAIPSSTAGGTYTTLTGAVYYEYASGDVGTGTIILNPPAGFVFDTGGTAPTVRIDRLSGSGANDKNINKKASGTSVAITSRSATQITFTVTDASGSGVSCSLTWQNVRVRPAAASPLASGNITKTGTSVMAVVTNSSTSFGRLIEIGPAARLAIQTQPSSTATAGAPFAQQPVVRIEDAVGNLLTSDNTTVVTATRSAGSGTLQGTTSRTAVNGLVSFTDLAHNVAGNITISFTSGTLTNATSTAIAVGPGAASQLAFTTQPANGTFGSLLATQPVLRSRDQFGNDSSIGLGANLDVTITLSAGTGPLLGTTTLDIGTSAGNGLISFTDLRIDSAGTDKQLTATASGLSNATSSVFTVAKANQTISFGALSARTYGDAPFTVGATASSALPVGFSIVSGPATISGNSVAITGAGTVTVRASQSGDVNWNAATSVDQSFAVAKKTVTGSITADSKTYDGTTAATIASRTLSGVIGADNVSLSGGTATFAGKTAGNGKTVTATGLSLSGTATGNYQLASTSATTTADITAKGLTATGVTANNKVYDGTTTATLNFGSTTLVGVVSGDAVTLNTSSAAGAFADENVGTAKTVTVSGLSLSGADAGNYTLTQPATTASITTHGLTVTGITADNKIYDGTTAATLNLSSPMLVGVASGDAVTLETSSATATFADANVGTNKTVTVSGLSLSGADAANYALVQPSATADITAATVTGSITADNKIYDGTTAATIATRIISGVVGSDNVSLSGGTATFADKNVSNGKSVTATGLSLSGADAGNYQLASTSATTTAAITARALTVSATGVNKVYDATTLAAVTLSDNRVSGDDLTTGYTMASFANKDVGTGKSVSVSGIVVTGTDEDNYTANTSAITTADITPATLMGSITAENKIYDGTTAATIATRDLSALEGSDDVSLVGGTATFADKNVGTGKSVTGTGLSLAGPDAANYQLASASADTSADITSAAVIGSITASSKIYDGTADATIATRTLSGVMGSEAVSLVGGTATFADKNAGTGKTVTATGLSLSGADAGNYQLASTSAATTAGITARTLTVSATGENKVYDGTTAATVTLSDNRVSGDYLTASYTTAEFANKNVGSGKTVSVSGISVSGTDAANYTASATAGASADITARALTVSAVGANKVYDGTTVAWATLLDDRIDGDDLTVSFTTASFADPDVQNGKLVSVSGISVTGADAGNYTANTEASTVADITGATLTVVGIVAENKVYDGTTVATLNLDGAEAIGLVSGDDVTVDASNVAGAFSDAEVGTGKLVTVSGLTLIGADAGKYILTQPTTTADITPAQ